MPQVQQDPVDDRGRRVRRLSPGEGRAPGVGDQAFRAEGSRVAPLLVLGRGATGQPSDLRQGLHQGLVGVRVAALPAEQGCLPRGRLGVGAAQRTGMSAVVAVGRPERLVGDAALDQVRARTDQGIALPDAPVPERRRHPRDAGRQPQAVLRPFHRLAADVHAVDAAAHHLAHRTPQRVRRPVPLAGLRHPSRDPAGRRDQEVPRAARRVADCHCQQGLRDFRGLVPVLPPLRGLPAPLDRGVENRFEGAVEKAIHERRRQAVGHGFGRSLGGERRAVQHDVTVTDLPGSTGVGHHGAHGAS